MHEIDFTFCTQSKHCVMLVNPLLASLTTTHRLALTAQETLRLATRTLTWPTWRRRTQLSTGSWGSTVSRISSIVSGRRQQRNAPSDEWAREGWVTLQCSFFIYPFRPYIILGNAIRIFVGRKQNHQDTGADSYFAFNRLVSNLLRCPCLIDNWIPHKTMPNVLVNF